MSTTLDELLQSLESDASGVEKQASDSTTNSNTLPGEHNEMSKEAAYEYGRALARELVKRANQITENDRAIQDVQASQVRPVPEGTVNDVLRGIMARDQERGHEDMDPDLEALLGHIAEGNADGHLSDEIRMALMGGAYPEQRGTGKLIATESAADEVEKAAAVNALVDAGISFDDASEIVKAASMKDSLKDKLRGAKESLGRVAKSRKGKIGAGVAGAGALAGAAALAAHMYAQGKTDREDESEGEKAAAVSALVAAGLPFEDASELVKAAAEEAHYRPLVKKIVDEKGHPWGKPGLTEKLRRAAEDFGRVAKSKKGKIGAGVAGAGALTGAAALAAHMYAQGKTDREDESEGEKAAAVSALVAAGLPFEDASDLVKAAAEEAHYRPLVKKIVDEKGHPWGKPDSDLMEKLRRAKEGLGRVAKSKKGKIGAGVAGAGALAGLAAHMYAQGKTDREDESEGEKAAAVSALVAAGLPFEDASDLVKAAAEEEEQKRRIGAVERYARALGRLALEGTAGGLAGLPLLPVSPVAATAVSSAGQLAGMVHGATKSWENTKRKNDLYDKQHLESEGEKAAAVNALVAAGLPFEDASDLVKAAAYELDKEASNDDLIAEILANLQG